METASGRWMPTELGIDEDPSFNFSYPMTPIDQCSIDDTITFQSFFSTSNGHHNFTSQTTHNDVSLERNPPQIISFENSGSSGTATSQKLHNLAHVLTKPKSEEYPCGGNIGITHSDRRENPVTLHGQNYYNSVVSLDAGYGLGCNGEGNKKNVGGMSRTPPLAKENVVAERKRREKLNQGFISLSAVVPGLKKTDRASVLGGAAKYLKYLQQRLESLEEQAARRTMESAVFVKKSHVYIDDESSSTEDCSDGDINQLPLPEMEARVSEKNVLIRIQCEKCNGYIQKILCELEKLPLSVVNCSALPFGNSILDVTIVAQMNVDFSTTAKELVTYLRKSLI